MKRFLLVLTFIVFLAINVNAAIKYVSPEGTGDGNSVGSPDTLEDAFTALKGTDGDHTLYCVEAGTYYLDTGSNYLNWNSLGDDLSIRAYSGLTAEDVIIEGGSARAFLIFNREDSDCLIEGVTIQNFTSQVSSPYTTLHILKANAYTVSNCRILNNTSIVNTGDCAGGGLYAGGLFTGTLIIEDSYFEGNSAFPWDDSENGQGGAVYFKGTGSVTISGNSFINNTASQTSGAVLIQDTAGAVRFSDNTYTGNFANAGQAGAVKIVGNTTDDVIFDGDSYDNNHSYGGPGIGAAGAIKLSVGASATIKNCKFSGNSGDVGGAIDCGGAFTVTTNIYNNIFTQNNARNGGAWSTTTNHSVNAYNNAYYNNTCTENGQDIKIEGTMTITIRNEIHQFNTVFNTVNTTSLIYANINSTLDIQYCDIEGGADAVTYEDTYTNNINLDPLFRNITREKFTVKDDSPCIGTGVDVSLTRDYNNWLIVGTPSIGAYQYPQNIYQEVTDGRSSVNVESATRMLSYSDAGDIYVDCTSGDLSLYLPPLAKGKGLSFLFSRIDATSNTLTILPSDESGTINGAVSQALNNQFNNIRVYGGNSEWVTKAQYCAEIYQNDNSTETIITTVNVWEEVDNFSSGVLNGWTHSTGDLTAGTGTSGTYLAIASISSSAASVNKDFEFAFSVDNSIQAKSISKRRYSNSDTGSQSISFLTTIDSLDVVKLEVRNLTDATNITVIDCNVTITKVN